jgi:hypothetical protein
MKLEGMAQKLIKEMENDGRVVTLSAEATARIDYDLAQKLTSIKEEFIIKERVSRVYIADVESGRINFYKSKSAYQKICDYFSLFT